MWNFVMCMYYSFKSLCSELVGEFCCTVHHNSILWNFSWIIFRSFWFLNSTTIKYCFSLNSKNIYYIYMYMYVNSVLIVKNTNAINVVEGIRQFGGFSVVQIKNCNYLLISAFEELNVIKQTRKISLMVRGKYYC